MRCIASERYRPPELAIRRLPPGECTVICLSAFSRRGTRSAHTLHRSSATEVVEAERARAQAVRHLRGIFAPASSRARRASNNVVLTLFGEQCMTQAISSQE